MSKTPRRPSARRAERQRQNRRPKPINVRRAKTLIWLLMIVLLVAVCYGILRVGARFDDFWYYIAVPAAALVGLFVAAFIIAGFVSDSYDKDEEFSTRVIGLLMAGVFAFTASTLLAPDWWPRTIADAERAIRDIADPDARTTRQTASSRQSTSGATSQSSTSTQRTNTSTQTSQEEDSFTFYFVARRSTKTFAKNDCPLPYGIKEYVTPIECTVVDIRDLFVVSQHLCFYDSKTGGDTPIRRDEYLALSRLKTTSRSSARDLREKVKGWPDTFSEGKRAGMIDTYYDAMHDKKNQRVPIMEYIGDLRTFQRSWDDLDDLRKALRGVGC